MVGSGAAAASSNYIGSVSVQIFSRIERVAPERVMLICGLARQRIWIECLSPTQTPFIGSFRGAMRLTVSTTKEYSPNFGDCPGSMIMSADSFDR